MKPLEIIGTKSTPTITFNAENHTLEFKGESRPEHVAEFYKPTLSWLEEYNSYVFDQIHQLDISIQIVLNFKMTYFNSTSAKYLFDCLNAISRIKKYPKVDVIVNWYYRTNDEEMEENGEDFDDMTDLKFNLIEY